MTDLEKAARMALEALEGFIPYLPLDDEEQCGRYDKAIAALRQALEQPAQQEPVKREHITDGSPCWCETETNYKDPETGVSVIVHKEPQ